MGRGGAGRTHLSLSALVLPQAAFKTRAYAIYTYATFNACKLLPCHSGPVDGCRAFRLPYPHTNAY